MLESLRATPHLVLHESDVGAVATITQFHVPARELGATFDHFVIVVEFHDGSFSTYINDGALVPEVAIDALCAMARAADKQVNHG